MIIYANKNTHKPTASGVVKVDRVHMLNETHRYKKLQNKQLKGLGCCYTDISS